MIRTLALTSAVVAVLVGSPPANADSSAPDPNISEHANRQAYESISRSAFRHWLKDFGTDDRQDLRELQFVALADERPCVTRGEYDAWHDFMSPGSVSALFDAPGWFIGSGDDFFRRGYNPCWDEPGERKVVVGYSQDDGLSRWIDVRDA